MPYLKVNPMKNTVSIIIPITDLENHANCISMLNDQSYENKEIICIAKDKSDLENHPNTKILEKEFDNLETAWNYGLNESNGKYILFLTEDSILENKDLLKNAIHNLESHELDFILYRTEVSADNEKRLQEEEAIAENKEFDMENKISANNDFKLYSINNVLNNSIFNHEDISEVIFEIPSIPMNKIYRKEFLDKNSISFKDSKFSSYLFCYVSILKADRIAYLKNESVKLESNDDLNDINKTFELEKENVLFNEYLETIIEIKGIFKNLSLFNQYKRFFYKKFIPHVFYQFKLDEGKREENFKIIKEYLPQIIDEGEEDLLECNAKNMLSNFKSDEYYENTINDDLNALFESNEIESFTIRHYKSLEKLNEDEDGISLSVIIPVYNSEKYIKECLDSILNQTLDNIEIVCIDDRSTDNSFSILQEYANENDNIKVFRNEENKGAGFTRNRGLSYIKGDCFAFVDSDDFLDETAYEKVLDLVKSEALDFAMFQLINYDDETGEVYPDSYYDIKCLGDDYTLKVFNHKDVADMGGIFKISVSPCNKIFNRAFIERIDARFKEGISFEDNIFFFKIFLNAERVSFYKEHLYYRRRRDDSVMGSYNENNVNVIFISSLILDQFQEEGYYEFYKKDLLKFKIDVCRNRLKQTDDKYKPFFYKIMREDFERTVDYTYERRLNEIDYKVDLKENLSKKDYKFFQDVLKYNEYKAFNSAQKLESKNSKLSKSNKKLKEENKKLKGKNKKIKKDLKYLKTMKGSVKYHLKKTVKK